jgi:hypothetical protein
MKRKLIGLVVASLVVGTSAAYADNDSFDDPYWKRAQSISAEATPGATQDDGSFGKYELVDRYNP